MLFLTIPSIANSSKGFDKLFLLWDKICEYINQSPTSIFVIINFSACRFLSPSAVAFLGGIARFIQYYSGVILFEWDTLPSNVLTNLAQNGFLSTFGFSYGPWQGNSVPYREDKTRDHKAIMAYLKTQWLGREWVHVSQQLRDAIVGRVWEIYANAFEHGQSPIGVLSCGQRYPQKKELVLTVIDFGLGIPQTVRDFYDPTLGSDEALQWAFEQGNTTKPSTENRRGLGFELLKQFVKANHGRLEVFSHNGYALIDSNCETFKCRSGFFNGTVINIVFKCDDRYYRLADEDDIGSLF